MQAADFVAKWRASQDKESAAYVSHFEDLCRLEGHQTPIEADPSGGFFCYHDAEVLARLLVLNLEREAV